MVSLSDLKALCPIVVWFIAAMMVVAPLSPHATSAVLCISEDGHVHAEKADGFTCDRTIGDRVTEQHTAHTESGSCTDVPLPSGGDSDCASFLQASTPNIVVAAQWVPDLPSVDTSREYTPAMAHFEKTEGWNAEIPFVRTVVLII